MRQLVFLILLTTIPYPFLASQLPERNNNLFAVLSKPAQRQKFQEAEQRKDIPRLQTFIDNGFDINENDTHVKSASTPLMRATKQGNIEAVRFYLQQNALVNKQCFNGETALHHACRQLSSVLLDNIDISIIKLLLQHGACPNIVDHNGHSPLHIAAANKTPGVVRVLLEYGADPNLTDQSNVSPVLAACSTKLINIHHNVMKKTILPLLQAGGNPNNQDDSDGHTALTRVYRPADAKLLLDHGANPMIKDHAGKNIFQLHSLDYHMFRFLTLYHSLYQKRFSEKQKQQFEHEGQPKPEDFFTEHDKQHQTPGFDHSTAPLEIEEARKLLAIYNDSGDKEIKQFEKKLFDYWRYKLQQKFEESNFDQYDRRDHMKPLVTFIFRQLEENPQAIPAMIDCFPSHQTIPELEIGLTSAEYFIGFIQRYSPFDNETTNTYVQQLQDNYTACDNDYVDEKITAVLERNDSFALQLLTEKLYNKKDFYSIEKLLNQAEQYKMIDKVENCLRQIPDFNRVHGKRLMTHFISWIKGSIEEFESAPI